MARGIMYRVALPCRTAGVRTARADIVWQTVSERVRPPCGSAALPAPPPPPGGMLSYCMWAQDVPSTKAQKENWLLSGLQDHRSGFCRKRDIMMPVG